MIGAEEVGWWRVGLPPEDSDVRDVVSVHDSWNCDLSGQDAALVVYAHEKAHDGIEKEPRGPKIAGPTV